jgi:hypothetical protein
MPAKRACSKKQLAVLKAGREKSSLYQAFKAHKASQPKPQPVSKQPKQPKQKNKGEEGLGRAEAQ